MEDPLGYLTRHVGQRVRVSQSGGVEMTGYLVSHDEHGNVVLSQSSRNSTEDDVVPLRFIRGEAIAHIVLL